MGEYYGVRMKDDPDGEYLQHWGILKGAMREGHKYLARLVTPNGYRYLYTQAQVLAAKAGRAVRNTTGIGLKSQVQAAKARAQRRTSENNSRREQSVSAIKRARNARNYAKNMQKTYDNSLLGRAEKAFNSARKSVSGQADKMYAAVRKAGKQAGKAIDNAVGGSAKRNLERQHERYRKQFGKPVDFSNRAEVSARDARYVNARRAYSKAQQKYDKTLMGRAEKALNSARERAGDAASAISNIPGAAKKAYKQAGRAVDNIVGGSAKKNLKRQQDRYNKAMASDAYLDMPYNDERRRKTAQRDARVKNAQQAYSKAEDRYGRTLMGRAEKARETAGRAISGAGRAISDAVNRPLRNAIGNTATMKRIDQAQAKRGRNARKEKTQQARVNAKQPTGSAVTKVTGATQRSRLLKEAYRANKALDRAHTTKERAANAYAKPINPDTPRPSMTDARIGRMRRATAKRAEEAANRAVRRVDNATQAYRYTPLGKSEERIYKATGTNTLRDSYDRYEKTQYKKKKKRR